MDKKVFTLFLLIIAICSCSLISQNLANPAPVSLMYYTGGLIPQENVNITLLEANVLIHANTTDLNALGEMSFSGNYIIFNHGSQANFTIAAPFEFYPTNNCRIIVNSTNTPYILIHAWESEADYWNPYLVNRSDLNLYDHFWLLCNVSFPQNSTLEISYQFNTTSNIYFPKWGYYYLIYDVGTSRLWNGNITERVEICVHGNLPNKIYYEEICNTIDLEDGKSYEWNWNNEVIYVNYVGVSYYFNNLNNRNWLDFLITIIIIVSIISVLLFIYILIKRRAKK
jgi:hypothetical protein